MCIRDSTYSGPLSNMIYAGADLFLMPSVSEPCGLSQMIAMRFGTVPIVRETGGLKDTVLPYNKFTGEGRGFTFSDVNAGDMLWVIREAVDLYYNDKEAWRGLQKAGMTADFSSVSYTHLDHPPDSGPGPGGPGGAWTDRG